jgi:hypothetical protein
MPEHPGASILEQQSWTLSESSRNGPTAHNGYILSWLGHIRRTVRPMQAALDDMDDAAQNALVIDARHSNAPLRPEVQSLIAVVGKLQQKGV